MRLPNVISARFRTRAIRHAATAFQTRNPARQDFRAFSLELNTCHAEEMPKAKNFKILRSNSSRGG
jgi:hypothetical protein